MAAIVVVNVKRRIGIVQTYLKSGENGLQRRVRSVNENGNVKLITCDGNLESGSQIG